MLLCNSIRAGYSAILGSSDLIVLDIIMNNVRNNSDFTCVVALRNDTTAILDRSDPTILNIACEYS